ncbi:prolyl-tRNA synthetase-like protein [Lindgomyces ingoldianus]|uniref:Prolyl-tRNA synthetase-like protein n=1 Tax=Lindgomyces ingoldianus TaxID=673940 RepID=A0ACB6RCH0_9PLEO|nr:prolyl-tRNA synthetase-like protein [Lindgomyces ingoldianus]KAF2476846.1 prolyl-tRNA synthetase-like protein [Lindgomyces ingoldianus]
MAANKASIGAKTVLPVGHTQKTEDILGITVTKEGDFSSWYQEVVLKSEMIEYYTEISGFFIMRPRSMFIWGVIQKWLTEKIEDMGVQEASFPMFLSEASLKKEKDHVEGFAPELAWVTKAGEKALEVPVAVRPTSEAVMYPYYAKWIRSHRDLPFRLNQWNSVVRWEATQTTPFLRAREFLWQEGHTAHLTEDLAGEEVLHILELYAGVYEKLLAVPVVRGRKTEKEKFAGGYYTTTVEGYIPSNGRGVQGGTSHCLGQNFSKMFDIKVEDPTPKTEENPGHIYVWQNSWGLSTRVIGVMVMIHGDDKGLVLPPRVAQDQVIIIPVGIKKSTTPEEKRRHYDELHSMKTALKKTGIRANYDVREGYTPAWKFNDHELKGVPLRLEYGPKDAAKSVVSYTRRDTGEKGTIAISDLASSVGDLLETIQSDMYTKAESAFLSHRKVITHWNEVVPALDAKNVVLMPFCLAEKCEDKIKDLTSREDTAADGLAEKKAPRMGMKSLCIPFEQPGGIVKGETKCLNPECGEFAEEWCMFGRSY